MIYNNYFHDSHGLNAMRFGGTYGARDNRFFNNIIENCGSGVSIGNKVFNTQVSYNLIKDCNSGIYENNRGDGTKIINNMVFGGDRGIFLAYTNKTEVMNNIAYVYSQESYPLYYNGYGNAPVIESNIWFNSESNKRVRWGKTDEYFTEDYENWILDHPGDIFSDPLLTNPDSGNFDLEPYSPAIDAGIDVGLTKDFEGNSVPQGNGPDIGAFEYSPN
jgi:parallel beta-helix repeat protein